MTEPAASINLAAGEAHSTPLEDVRARLSKPSSDDEVLVMDVPKRPGFTVRYSSVIPYEVAQSWYQTATNKKSKKIDVLRLACLGLSAQCEAIQENGEDLRDDDGELITFMSPWLREAVAATGEDEPADLEAVRKFYRSDGHVGKAFNYLLDDAGYSLNDDELDPTQR